MNRFFLIEEEISEAIELLNSQNYTELPSDDKNKNLLIVDRENKTFWRISPLGKRECTMLIKEAFGEEIDSVEQKDFA